MCICESEDKGYFGINDTIEYSGFEIGLSSTGFIRVRKYDFDSDFGWKMDGQDVLKIRYCPLCGKRFEKR